MACIQGLPFSGAYRTVPLARDEQLIFLPFRETRIEAGVTLKGNPNPEWVFEGSQKIGEYAFIVPVKWYCSIPPNFLLLVI